MDLCFSRVLFISLFFASSVLAELPTDAPQAGRKPVAKTIVGAVLLGEGVVATTVGVVLLTKYAGTKGGFADAVEASIGTLFGAVATIEGTCAVVPGVILLTRSSRDWRQYHEQEKKTATGLLNTPVGVGLYIEF